MNKAEIISAVSDKLKANSDTAPTKKQIDLIMTALLEVVVEEVAQGEKVTFVGFGTFEKRIRQAREGRNPKTNEKMLIPEGKVPAFSAGKSFREAVSAE